MAKFKKGDFVIYNGHLVKVKDYYKGSDYVEGIDERDCAMNFMEDFGEFATLDSITDWVYKNYCPSKSRH